MSRNQSTPSSSYALFRCADLCQRLPTPNQNSGCEEFLDSRDGRLYDAWMPLSTSGNPGLLRKAKRAAKSVLDINQWYFRAAGGYSRPAFYNIDETYPCLRELDRNYPVIREEVETVLAQRSRLPRYHELAKREQYISGTIDADKDWKVFMLRSLVGTPEANQKKCPLTTALLAPIPNLYQAFFSILDPGKSIPAHCGFYLGYLRYHLGLVVPKNNPPSMRVNDQIHIWEEGKSILFDDSWEHEVYNKSDGLRVVLIVDLLRPMPRPLHAINTLLTHVLGRHSEEAKQIMANIKKYS
jgi:aspartyl/asparaginyl beta-hydroxylase (cupin superfamily)